VNAVPDRPGGPTPTGIDPFPAESENDPVAQRALRADAARNRERVIAAATEAFASEGIDVSMEAIARRAGVGVATIYRQFPTKESLFAAIVETEMDGVRDFARHLEQAEDAGEALFQFVCRVVETAASKRDLAEALERSGAKSKQNSEVEQMWRATVAPLVERARQTGAVRSDADVDEVLYLISGTCSAVMHHEPDRGVRTRMARVICDGLRPEPGTARD
jgi:AcrR family transcriptional regulator